MLLMRWKCKHITDWQPSREACRSDGGKLGSHLLLKNQENENHLPVAKTHFHTFVDSYLNDSIS